MRSILFLFLFCYVQSLWATVEIVNISGISGSKDDKSAIYGGIAGTCATQDNASTCDSCTGTGLVVCNHQSIYPNLALTFTLKSSEAGTYKVMLQVNEATVVQSTIAISADTEFSLATTWGAVCGQFDGWNSSCVPSTNCDSTTQTGCTITENITVGLDKDNNGEVDSDNSKSIEVNVQSLPTNIATVNMLTDTCKNTTPSANVGLCYLQLFPGDEKIYILDHLFATNSATSDLGLDYQKAIFFYEEKASTDASDLITLGRVTNASARVEIDLKTEEIGFPDNRLNGFTNEQKYCFVHANQNQAGNIIRFTNSTVFSSEVNNLCVTPIEVIGLLADKKCFIATATFGGPLAPPVEVLRQFRNQILWALPGGKVFVKWYYESSPPWAQWIHNHSWAKPWVQILLWPVVVLAYLLLHPWLLFSLILVIGLSFFGKTFLKKYGKI